MALLLHVEPYWVSPYVFAVFVTLREKGLEFESAALDHRQGETSTAPYLNKTITGRVPTLIHDDLGVGESSAIIEYLEETFPEKRVLPESPAERARCRQLMSWLRSDETLALRAERSTHTIFYDRNTTPLTDAALLSARKLVEVAGRVIRAGQPHLFGAWSIVDSELAFALHRLIVNGDPVPSGIKEWAETQWERPTVRAFVEIVRPNLRSY
jgi:glutathione S-transferase